MITFDDKAGYYHMTKAEGERIVRTAHSACGIRTASVRFCLGYGKGDDTFMPSMLRTYETGKNKVQMGYNTALHSFTSAENVATGHILVARALASDILEEQEKVGGQVFYFTDGVDYRSWDVARMIWRAAGDSTNMRLK